MQKNTANLLSLPCLAKLKVNNKKTLSVLKLLVVVVIVALFVWFIFIKPSYNYSKYEKTLE